MAGGKPARKASASVSLGHRQPTFLLAPPILSHIDRKMPVISFIPKKNSVVYLNAVPSLAPRPKYHASHGAMVVTLGIPLASHWSATGFVVSGVDDPTTMSTLSVKMSSRAMSAA